MNNVYNSGGGIIAYRIFAVRVKVLLAFRKAGAVTPQSARTLDDLGLDSGSQALRYYQHHGVIRQAENACWYLDQTCLDRFHRKERWQFALICAAMIGVCVLAAVLVAVARTQ